jgi:hypothetical protein
VPAMPGAKRRGEVRRATAWFVAGLAAIAAALAADPGSARPEPAPVVHPGQPPAADAPAPEPQGPATTIHEVLQITAVTVPVRFETKKGHDPVVVAPEDVTVREDGEIRNVVSLVRLADQAAATEPATDAAETAAAGAAAAEPGPEETAESAPAPTRIAIYVDVPMTTAAALRSSLQRLRMLAEHLTRLGEVEITVADPDPVVALEPTRDTREVRRVLHELSYRGGGLSGIERIRLPVLRGEEDVGRHRDLLLARAREEVRFVGSRQMRLGVWAASTPSLGRPRILFLVSGGFDEDPRDFYLDRLENTSAPGSRGSNLRESVSQRTLLETDLRELARGPEDEALGSDLAALGWLVFPVVEADIGWNSFNGADEPGLSHWLAMARGATQLSTAGPPLPFSHPLAGWSGVAAPSGGEVLGTDRQVERSVRALGDVYLLTYERSGPPTGATHRLSVEIRGSDALVHAPRQVSEGTPESVAGLAAVRLLQGGVPESDLPVKLGQLSDVRVDGRREVHLAAAVDVGSLLPVVGPSFGGSVRLTLAVTAPKGAVRVLQRLASAPHGSPLWRFDLTVQPPPGASRVALTVEDLGSGLRGGAVLELPAADGEPATPRRN